MKIVESSGNEMKVRLDGLVGRAARQIIKDRGPVSIRVEPMGKKYAKVSVIPDHPMAERYEGGGYGRGDYSSSENC